MGSDETETSLTSSMQDRPKTRIRLQDAMSSEADTSADFSSINNLTPERVFKVIFVGDTCVGKSSLIRRICQPSGWSGPFGIKSTIGVDFQTRSLVVDQTSICIQCWDTAGQERYRSGN